MISIRTSVCTWVGSLILAGGLLAAATQEPTDQAAAKLIDTYVDLRYDATPESIKTLLESLAKVGVSEMAALEAALRGARAVYPDSSDSFGKTTTHDVECLHVDYKSRYFLNVPSDLKLDKPVSLVVVGHGGNSSMSPQRAEAIATMYLRAYQSMSAGMNTLLVAPASGRGWGQIGNSLIFSTISDVQRKYPIDPDRIYITGQSMGGHLAFRSALSLPDRFGAVSPHSGGYDFVEKHSIGGLINVPGYAVWGKREPYGINKDNRTNAKWAESHDADWKFVEKDGGHEIYQDELANVAKFFNDRPRELYREQVYIRGGAMKFVKPWGIKGWPEHKVYHETKPLRWNMRHWIEIEPSTTAGEVTHILATNLGDNRFEITTDKVRNLSVFLHPKMVDLDKPIVISVNKKEVHNSIVPTNPSLMFDLAREFDDRGRVFWAKVELKIDTDLPVEIKPAK